MTKLSVHLKAATLLAGLFSLFILSHGALAAGDAEGLGQIAERVTSNISAFTKLITAAAYLAGLGFFVAGVMQFKAHKDNPAQVPLSKPIVLILIGACLVYMPSLLKASGSTLFESGTAGGVSGDGLDNLG